MFSFHKPKVYRSTTGCCICKAKSSSSRFTDSTKYESDFIKCFHLKTPRQGEICNACVLLVKRWKKLPPGSTRNWQHVVDARAGPGMKSMTKFKSKHKKLLAENESGIVKGPGPGRKKKHFEREQSPLSDKSDGGQDVDLVMDIDYMSEIGTSTNSPGDSDCEDSLPLTSRRQKPLAKRRDLNQPLVSEFIDLDMWKKVHICCGTIFESPAGEFLVDLRFLKPCNARLTCKMQSPASTSSASIKQDTDIAATKSFSDSSSDSGYDESSNQGANSYNTRVPSSPDAIVGKKHEQVSIIDGQVPVAN